MGIFQGEANFIKYMLTNQCARPWYVYVETFLPSFMELLLTVTLLEIDDLIRSHGQKIASEGGNKTGRGGRHTPRIKTTGAATPVDRYMQKGLKTLLIVTQPLENIGYAWLLYSAMDEFFYNWQTLIEQADFCTQPIESGPLTRSRGPGFVTINTSGFPIFMTDMKQNRAGWVNDLTGAELPQGHMSMLFAATIGTPPGGITNVFIRVRVINFFGTTDYESDHQDIPDKSTRDFVVNANFFNPTGAGGTVTWQLVGPAVPVGIFCGKAVITISRVG